MPYRTFGPPAALALLSGSLATPAQAQLPPPPPNATPLQANVFNAVAKMCITVLDKVGTYPQAIINDLHDQCHAIALSNLTLTTSGSNAAASAIGALQQVSGNQISTQGSLATRVSAGQFGNITGRLNALRFGASASLSQGFTAQNDGSGEPFGSGTQVFALDRSALQSAREDGYPMATNLPSASSPWGGDLVQTGYGNGESNRAAKSIVGGGAGDGGVENPWGLFLQGSYNSGKHDQTVNEDPFDFHAASVTAGVDYNFGNAVLGASIGHDNYDAGIQASGLTVSGGSSRVQGTSGSLYGAWFGPQWYFNGIFNYGKLKSDLSREVKYSVTFDNTPDPLPNIPGDNQCNGTICSVSIDRTLKASPNGTSYAFGASAGYQYAAAGWDLSPSLSVNYRRARFDSFSESDPNSSTDGLGLAFGEQTVESLRSILGLQVSRPISASFGVVSPVVRVEWNHEFKNGARAITANYANDPSCTPGPCASAFVISTDSPASNYGTIGGGVVLTLARRIQMFVYDEALFGYSNYHSNSISLGVRGQL